MDSSGISAIVDEVVRNLAGRALVDDNPSKLVGVGVSNRHGHLTPEHAEILFGPGKRLTSLRPLLQPDQFASKETVSIATAKGVLHNVRLIGPERNYTQVEISRSDAIALGLDPPIRQSGSLSATPGCVIIGPAGSVVISHGVVLASRHLHCHSSEGAALGLKDQQIIKVKAAGERGGVLENVLVRVGNGHKLELHIDTDEANAFGLKSGDRIELVYQRAR